MFAILYITHNSLMQLHTIETGYFKLDGGAMFGVVPKMLWNRLNPADDNNLCTWAMRCLLLEYDNRIIVVDTGIGNKQSDKFFAHYDLHGHDSLEKSLQAKGVRMQDVTDVILTHLHFDHVGGAVSWNADKTGYIPTFKNATYWTNEKHYLSAIQPNNREKASFLKENILPLQAAEQLQFLEKSNFGTAMEFITVNGHTESMSLPLITYQGNTYLFAADLLPSSYHIPLPYIMGYDMQPLVTLSEKEQILQQAVQNNWIIVYQHDPHTVASNLIQTEKGIQVGERMNFI